MNLTLFCAFPPLSFTSNARTANAYTPPSAGMGARRWNVVVFDRRCQHDFKAEGMDEIESHSNAWKGFEKIGEDEETGVIYGDKMA